MNMKPFEELLNYPNDFKVDLVIYDYTIGPCFLGFVHKFNYPPMIAVSAFNYPSYTSEIAGGHQFYAYVAHQSLPATTHRLTFLQRLLNLVIYTGETM